MFKEHGGLIERI